MASDPGADISLQALLFPIPVVAYGSVARALATIPVELAAPHIKGALLREHAVDLQESAIGNVLWKLKQYLPSLLPSPSNLNINSPDLKVYQAAAPEQNTVSIVCSTRTCTSCAGDLVLCKPKDRAKIHRGFCSTTAEHRFKFYSMGAGVQLAQFTETTCPKCHLYFLGGWCYKKNCGSSASSGTGGANFGKCTDIKYAGEPDGSLVFVIPKEKAWYAVDLKLLRFITDELQFSGGTFSSSVLVWAKQHPGESQQNLILGKDLTQKAHTTSTLAAAWYVYNAVLLAGAAVSTLTWSFTEHGMEQTLQAVAPLLRREHLRRLVDHIRKCPRCAAKPVILLDGKQGAKRFVCAGLDGYQHFHDFNIKLHAGCSNNAPAGQHFCAKCRPAKMQQSHLIPQHSVLGIQESADAEGAKVQYLVQCQDPAAPDCTFDALLPRSEVRADLLHGFEKGLLPRLGDHGNQKPRPGWVKGHKQLARWLSKRKGACEHRARSRSSRSLPAKLSGVGNVDVQSGRGRAGEAQAPPTPGDSLLLKRQVQQKKMPTVWGKMSVGTCDH